MNDKLNYAVCKELLNENYSHQAVRQISVSVTKLEDEQSMQLNLFDEGKWERCKLVGVMDEIRTRYGPLHY